MGWGGRLAVLGAAYEALSGRAGLVPDEAFTAAETAVTKRPETVSAGVSEGAPVSMSAPPKRRLVFPTGGA